MKKFLLSAFLLSSTAAFSWFCESYSSWSPECNGWASYPSLSLARKVAVRNCQACTPVGYMCSAPVCD